MNKKNKKRILYGGLGILGFLIFAALIVPSFVDANQYKDMIAERVHAATGRALVIDGDIDLAILPAPALSVHQIRLANLEGASRPYMAEMAALRVRVALFPLFTGRIQVESIAMINPVVELETLADGRANWEFAAPADAEGGEEARQTTEDRPEETAPADVNAIQVDRFTIENGTLVYRDGAAQTIERIEKLNADIRAESLVGPFHVDGGFVAHGLPVLLRLATGRLVEGPGTPIDLEVKIENGEAVLAFSGTLSAPNPTGVLTGTVTADSANPAIFLGRAGVTGAALPGFLAQKFSYKSLMVGSSTSVELREMALGFGGTTAKGSVKALLGKTVDVAVAVQMSKIDLDRWLAMPADADIKGSADADIKGSADADIKGSADADIKGSADAALKGAKADADIKGAEAVPSKGGEASPGTPVGGAPAGGGDGLSATFALPENINGSFDFVVDSIDFQGAAIHKARVHASLANGELALDQATAQLPGGASLSMFGFVSAVKGKPRFEGDLDFRSKNLRSLLNWLQVDIADVPAGRVRATALTAKLVVDPKRVRVEKLNFKLDQSQVTGTLSAALAGRPDVRGNLSMNRLNLDAYLGKGDQGSPSGASAKASGDTRQAKQKEKKKEKQAAESAWKVLDGFDGDLIFSVGRLTFQKQPIAGIRLAAALKQGTLTLREASVQNLAGAHAKLSGKANKFSTMPAFDVRLDLRSKDVSQLFRLTGATPPAAVARLGGATLAAQFVGDLDRLKLNAELGTAKGTFRANGDLGHLSGAPDFNLHLAAAHPDLAAFLKIFDYRTAKLGALNLKAQLKGTPASAELSNLDGHVGPVKLAGHLKASFDGPRPMVVAKVEAVEIPVHRFAPVAHGASAKGAAGASTASRGALAGSGAGSKGRWSKTPIDLSGLRLVDANVDLSAVALVYDNIRVQNPRFGIVLKDGVLDLNKLSGDLFGGSFDATAKLADQTHAVANGKLAVRGANIGKALFASSGFDLGDGNLDFDLDLKTAGKSEQELVSALNGVAKINVKDGVAKGFDLDAVSAKMDNLNSPEAFLGLLDSALSGGETRFEKLSGTARVVKGVAQMEAMHMQAKSGTADLTGKVDLPNWNMDLRADFNLASEPGAPVFAMLLKGPLDNPHRRFDTKKFQSHLVKKGIGSLLKKVLPKQLQTPESAAPAGKEGGEEAAPEKIIKDLLKGFGF